VVAAGLLRRLFAGMAVDEAMLALVRDLRAAGLLVGLLSNSWANTYPDELLALFDAVVISGEVGLRKPDPVIYGLLLDKLAVPAARSVFVDDAPVNVAAAIELGMHGIRHEDANRTRAALTDLIPALAKDVTE
jgi:putative hydrolase of the HAD superfamily